MKKTLILCLALTLTCLTSFSQDTTSITSVLNRSGLGKHYAFALYKDGKMVYKKEAGDFNIKTQQDIAASSQWLTAAMVMIMVQEGKISLDDKVSTYLPLFAKHGKAYITIRHCLMHNTGIDGPKPLQKSNFKNLEEEVDYYAVNCEIKTNPGTEFYYSNIGPKIAARILEVVTKRPFDRLIKEKLTSPLAMRNTTFANDNYDRAPDPANGAKSTAADYLNFLAMLLNKGTLNGRQVLTEESVKTLLSLQAKAGDVKNAPKEAAQYDYALGSWVISKKANDATALTAPGTNGVYPVVDVCRGYAFVIFAKDGTEVKKEVALQVKGVIDGALKGSCE